MGNLPAAACAAALLAAAPAAEGAQGIPKQSSTWPQPYEVRRDEAAGILSLRTPYYAVEHDLRRGGAVSRIALAHGRAPNLLVRPIEARVREESGTLLTDLNDPAPAVAHRREGMNEIVEVDCALTDGKGGPAALRLKTAYEYRWGYVRVRREFLAPAGGFRAREVCPFSTTLAPGLCEYGYREGKTEEEGAGAFSFGSNRWGRMRPDQPPSKPLQLHHVPRSMIFADPGVEGLEWFAGSDLTQWDLQLTGRRGGALCSLEPGRDPPGLALSISPLWSADAAHPLPASCVFEYRLAVPLHEGRAHAPWLHTSFNRNRGNWVSERDIAEWARKGIQTAHCHNDGDYYDDGLFWRDGSYPPYPDMDRYDKVLRDCRAAGIRTATYFSNKELHPDTPAFRQNGESWGRKDRKGRLRHNFFRGKSEFGAQMCLRSGWLDFLKGYIDRVLRNHPLDGVYYDWNVSLLCCNTLHEEKDVRARAGGHWDMDELMDLMEWTRRRVGPGGLVIVHNTTVPMYAVENFADYVVATEWGYKKWTERAADLKDLPLEWSLAGARPRGVISYGIIDPKAPRRLHRLFALEAFLGGSTPWPAGADAFELASLLKPLGDIGSYRFADWRNEAVGLPEGGCAAAVYSRPGEAWLLLANLEEQAREVTCVLRPGKLPCPLEKPTSALRAAASPAAPGPPDPNLNVSKLTGEGVKLTIAGDGAVLIQVR